MQQAVCGKVYLCLYNVYIFWFCVINILVYNFYFMYSSFTFRFIQCHSFFVYSGSIVCAVSFYIPYQIHLLLTVIRFLAILHDTQIFMLTYRAYCIFYHDVMNDSPEEEFIGGACEGKDCNK